MAILHLAAEPVLRGRVHFRRRPSARETTRHSRDRAGTPADPGFPRRGRCAAPSSCRDRRDPHRQVSHRSGGTDPAGIHPGPSGRLGRIGHGISAGLHARFPGGRARQSLLPDLYRTRRHVVHVSLVGFGGGGGAGRAKADRAAAWGASSLDRPHRSALATGTPGRGRSSGFPRGGAGKRGRYPGQAAPRSIALGRYEEVDRELIEDAGSRNPDTRGDAWWLLILSLRDQGRWREADTLIHGT